MSVFKHPITLSARSGEASEVVEALVDSGASYTLLPASTLERLGVRREFEQEFILGDGRRLQLSLGVIELQINGKRMPTPCIFGEEGTEALLGAVTLEQFGLGVDPIGERLVPVPGYLV